MVRLGEGRMPRRGHVRLGEPEDRKMGPSCSPRQGCCLPRRRKAMPRRAGDCLRPAFMACLGSVSWPGS